jgi:hypothetical protein
MDEIPNDKLKIKHVPTGYSTGWEDFALSFNGYKYAGDVCFSFPNTIESYYDEHGNLPTHLTLSELRMCVFFVQRRYRHNGFLPSLDYINDVYDAIRAKIKSASSLPQHQQATFNLYNKRATFFDLIDGEHETKQTKGLAYVLHSCPDFLALFLEHFLANHGVTVSEFDYISVDAEMMSSDTPPIRRDITISCYRQNIKKCVIVIEGKTIKGLQDKHLKAQLQQYMTDDRFAQDAGVPILGVSLTKYRYAFEPWSSMIGITWTEVIELLWNFVSKEHKHVSIAQEYLQFLMKVDHGMNFYEAEVLSLAAQKTEPELKRHHIYACANHKTHPTALFMTFRAAGGVMDTLYKVNRIFVADPKHHSFEQQISYLPEDERIRVLAFVAERNQGYGFKYDEEYRFYILSETEKIALPHHPRPEVPNQTPRRYTLATLLNGQQVV